MLLEGAREYAHLVYMCFVNLKKAYDRVPREKLGGAAGGPSNLCIPKAIAVSAFSAASQSRSRMVFASTRAELCLYPVCDIHGQDIKA